MPYRSATVPEHGELRRPRTIATQLRARRSTTAPAGRAARRKRAVLGTLALGEGFEPSILSVTTTRLTVRLPEIVAGTGGVEPPSSELQSDARSRFSYIPKCDLTRSLLPGDVTLPRSRGRARSAQRHGASVHAAQESRATLFVIDDAVFKGRVEDTRTNRARNWCDRWGSNPLRLASQASASTASASATMQARNESNAHLRVWNPDRRLDTSPRKDRGDRLRADPLVMFTGVPERQLPMQRILSRRADPSRRRIDEAIRTHGPQTVAFGSW
jgi:hypothetical protein